MHSTMITIRKATLGDVPFLRSLISESVRILQASYYTPEQREGALGSVFGVDTQLILDGTYMVAEAGTMIVGCGDGAGGKLLSAVTVPRIGTMLCLIRHRRQRKSGRSSCIRSGHGGELVLGFWKLARWLRRRRDLRASNWCQRCRESPCIGREGSCLEKRLRFRWKMV